MNAAVGAVVAASLTAAVKPLHSPIGRLVVATQQPAAGVVAQAGDEVVLQLG